MKKDIVLSIDLGGTKTFCAVHSLAALKKDFKATPDYTEELACANYKSFTDLLDTLYKSLEKHKIARPTLAVLGIAGPIHDNENHQSVVISNLSWPEFTNVEIQERYGIARVTFINDFTAVGYGIRALTAEDLIDMNAIYCEYMTNIGKADHVKDIVTGSSANSLKVVKATTIKPILFLGAGTGLGVGFLFNNQVIQSEGGHTTFSPLSELDVKFAEFVKAKYRIDHVSFERLVSGMGIHDLHEFLYEYYGGSEHNIPIEGSDDVKNPSDKVPRGALRAQCEISKETNDKNCINAILSEYATEYNNPYALEIFKKFFYYYGVFVGNHIVSTLPSDVYIAGGIMIKNIHLLKKGVIQSFYDGLYTKGRMSIFPKMTRIWLIDTVLVGVYGSGVRATDDA